MKANYQRIAAGRAQRSSKGFTLIEITAVIGLLISLISVLFLGVTAYKAGSEKAQCLLIQVTCQKAVRSYANLGQFTVGDPAPENGPGGVLGSGNYAADFGSTCPGGGTLIYLGTVPAGGVEWVTCSIPAHVPANTTSW